MKLIAITHPDITKFNPAQAEALLQTPLFFRLHLRFENASQADYQAAINAMSPVYYPLISIHDYHHLAMTNRLGGVHLNSRNPVPPHNWHGITSASCHSFDEVRERINHFDYLFISPVFDSISKQGYRSAFSEEQLQHAYQEGLINNKLVALGGVTFDNLPLLEQYHFSAAALLGALWR